MACQYVGDVLPSTSIIPPLELLKLNSHAYFRNDTQLAWLILCFKNWVIYFIWICPRFSSILITTWWFRNGQSPNREVRMNSLLNIQVDISYLIKWKSKFYDVRRQRLCWFYKISWQKGLGTSLKQICREVSLAYRGLIWDMTRKSLLRHDYIWHRLKGVTLRWSEQGMLLRGGEILSQKFIRGQPPKTHGNWYASFNLKSQRHAN